MIKTEVKICDEEDYPCLKIFYDTIVLFTAHNTGICIVDKSDIGNFHDAWAEKKFQKFDGEVILKNV